MAHRIIEETCVRCGICIDSCPTRCISKDAEGSFKVDAYYCIDCGVCASDCCVKAIVEE